MARPASTVRSSMLRSSCRPAAGCRPTKAVFKLDGIIEHQESMDQVAGEPGKDIDAVDHQFESLLVDAQRSDVEPTRLGVERDRRDLIRADRAVRHPVRPVGQRRPAQRRFGRPDEVARIVGFLAADESSYITGQVWGVNGGMDM